MDTRDNPTATLPPLTAATVANSLDSGKKGSSETEARLEGVKLTLARVSWAIISLLSVGLFVAVIPVAYHEFITLAFLPGEAEREIARQGFAQLGLSAEFFANYVVGLMIFRTLIYFAVGTAIFARKSDSTVAILVSIFLMTYSVARILVSYPVTSDWNLPTAIITATAYSSLILIFTFPDGRFVPAWTRYPAAAWVIFMAVINLLPNSMFALANWALYFNIIAAPIFLGTGVFAQIYRYRHVSSTVERQQTKWVVFAVAVVLAVTFITNLLPTLDSTLILGHQPAERSVVFELVVAAVSGLSLLLIPVALVIAILRYRLWEIDLLINRTLVYVPLTGIVAGLYAASVALFQRVFIALTGQQSDAAIIVTTLIVASLFTPIKNSLQNLVDKRFKEAPNPAKKLSAFGGQLKSVIEVFDVERVTQRALEEAVEAFDAKSGAIYLRQGDPADGTLALAHSVGDWNDGQTKISVPVAVEATGAELGVLQLGPRRNGSDYSDKDREILLQNAEIVAATIAITRHLLAPGKATPQPALVEDDSFVNVR
jgi:hypothetical protein